MSNVHFSYPVMKVDNTLIPGVDVHLIDPKRLVSEYVPDDCVGHMLDAGEVLCGAKLSDGKHKVTKAAISGRVVCSACQQVYKEKYAHDPEMIKLLNWMNGGTKLFKYDLEQRAKVRGMQ